MTDEGEGVVGTALPSSRSRHAALTFHLGMMPRRKEGAIGRQDQDQDQERESPSTSRCRAGLPHATFRKPIIIVHG